MLRLTIETRTKAISITSTYVALFSEPQAPLTANIQTIHLKMGSDLGLDTFEDFILTIQLKLN